MSANLTEGKSYQMGHLSREDHSTLLKSVSEKYKNFSIDNVLFKNETVEWVRVLNYWQSLRNNPAAIAIWVSTILLLVPTVIEPLLLHAKWNISVAMAPYMFVMIPFILFLHVRGSVEMVTNYRVMTINIGRNSYTSKYILLSKMTNSNNSISVQGKSVVFEPNNNNNNNNARRSSYMFNNNRIKFNKLDDAESVKRTCQKQVDMMAAPIPSSSISWQNVKQENNNMLSKNHSYLLQSYLSVHNSESIAHTYFPSIRNIPRYALMSVIFSALANIWMYVFLFWDTPEVLKYMIIAQAVMLLFIFFMYKIYNTPSILTNLNILTTGKGIVVEEGLRYACGLSYIRPVPLSDIGLIWTYNEMKGAATTKGIMHIVQPRFLRLESNDILALEEYVCSRVHELHLSSFV
eukprot:TRINITY_DN2725_c0_g2_i1.p1 TRINITY_DN2725_c0_g2~~TRINITY_DN2725_c0_g2_i1.p1  ORF type:complete len:405 (+),score=76.72 TRINITY_DN2725_c0_g2_i1:131-1345(+)